MESEKKKEKSEKEKERKEEKKKKVKVTKVGRAEKAERMAIGEKAQMPKSDEVEKLVVELFKQGNSPEKIGMILRDSYGIGDVKAITGKKITRILKEKGFKVFPPDLLALQEKMKALQKHFEKHKHDYVAKRRLQRLEAQIRILTDYHKRRHNI